ncbi:MAG: PaaI family thioesterase [Spirochaetia bacterium]|jgi:uncharacterized protein (TIGR00369 family)|nr:PaaI family thioesterase [Spirochaetia bacterium]
MKHIVTGKQENSRMCFICGLENQLGLKTTFYSLDNGELAARFTARDEHQGYPGRLHGGIAASILDETIGRAIAVPSGKTVWGVTVDISLKYRKPIPLGVELTAIGRIVSENNRFFEGTGEIILPDGSIAITAKGRYMKLSIDKIASGVTDPESLGWKVIESEGDPDYLEIP